MLSCVFSHSHGLSSVCSITVIDVGDIEIIMSEKEFQKERKDLNKELRISLKSLKEMGNAFGRDSTQYFIALDAHIKLCVSHSELLRKYNMALRS